MAAFGGLLVFLGLLAFVVGLVALVRGHLDWARIRSRKAASLLGVAAFGVFVVGGQLLPSPPVQNTAVPASATSTTATTATTLASTTPTSTRPSPAAITTTTAAPTTTAATPATTAPTVTALPAAPPVVAAPVPPPLAPTPRGDFCGAPQNPYGYNYCGRGATVTNPPGDVCTYFICIANFPNGRGYMEECRDSTVSKSGGIRGSCSQHGGDQRAITG